MRIKANYTIEEKIKVTFDEICKEESINKSQWIENRMREFIKENGYILIDKKEVK